MESSSLDESLRIPNTLMARRDCLQTSLFPGLLVYHCLAYSDGLSESPFNSVHFFATKVLQPFSSVGKF
jgi:hypothetical protein